MSLLEAFKDWKDIKELPARTVIFSENDEADVMYVLLKGEVELSLRGEPLGIESEGGIFGEMAMINTAKRSATATTLTGVKLAQISRDQFRQIVADNIDFSLQVMAVLANRLRAADQFIAMEFGQDKAKFSG